MDQLWQFLQSIHFENPHFIWWRSPVSFGCLLLVCSIGITAGLWWLWYRGRVQAIKDYGTTELVARWTALPRLGSASVVLAGLVLMLVFGLTAATMPYQSQGAVSVPAGSLRVVSLFDVSRSMGAENRDDPSLYGGRSCTMVEGPCGRRVETARLILQKQIMPAIAGNQLAVVVYSMIPVTKSFLNNDFEPINYMLDTGWVDVGTAMGDGTYLHNGINAAVKMFERDPAESGETNVILLFTDGENHSKPEELQAAIDAAKKVNAIFIIVGIGSTKPSFIPLYDGNNKPVYKDGQRAYHMMSDGSVAQTVRVDAFLRQLAATTGGSYVIAEPGKAVDIDWPRSFAGSKVEVAKQYWYHPLVAGMLVILALLWLAVPLATRARALVEAGADKRGHKGRA
jgi:hypothetical protein